MDDNIKYRELFFEETDEYLQKLNENLLLLEKDDQSPEILEEIFRSAHTLKGMAATMGYTAMTELTHRMENVLELFRKGKAQVTSEALTVIFHCLDQLSEIVEDLREENEPVYDMAKLFLELEHLCAEAPEAQVIETPAVEESSLEEMPIGEIDASVIRSALEKGYLAYKITVLVNPNCMLKGARAYLVVNRLEQEGEIMGTLPQAEELEDGNFDKGFQLLYITKSRQEVVEESILNVAEIDGVVIHALTLEDLPQSPAVLAKPRGAVVTNLAETIKTETPAAVPVKEPKAEGPAGNKADSKVETKNGNGAHGSQSIRVDLSRLDSFMNLVSELVIYRTRLEEISQKQGNGEITEPLEQVARITSDLQDLVLKIRMQPVNVVFNRFPRMVRDLSQELGKDMELLIEGEETELDRTVVSELGEPLVHLLRNAADHGIETAEEREKKGKPAHGKIHLLAYQEGNSVVIKVSDDGQGIDPERIRESAERKGISTEGLDRGGLIQLIFNSGFSTNTEVTNISGRGVGMDVVKQKITSLGGSIEVLSQINVGTTFVIRLPLTLSIIQALMVHVGRETFALPLGFIEKVVALKEGDIKAAHSGEIYIHREKVIPVVRVSELLNIKAREGTQHIILVSIGGRPFGLVVDELMGQQEIVIKKLSGSLGKMKEYLGASILGNGDITLILDVGNLVQGKGETLE